MPPVHKKRKLEQLAVSESCSSVTNPEAIAFHGCQGRLPTPLTSSLAAAWHDIDDIRRRVLSVCALSIADLLHCELVCKHWRDLDLPLLLPIHLSIKEQSHVAWLQHNVSRVGSLSVVISDILQQGRVWEYGTLGTCDIPASHTDICSLQQLDHMAIADLLGEAKLAKTLTIDGLQVKKLPNSLSGLTGLQQLTLKGLPALLEVSFDVVAALTSLTDFKVSMCCSLKHLGDGISKLTQLKRLQAGCSGYGSTLDISSKIGGLTGLQHLKLVHTNLPHTLVQLASLQTLKLVHPHSSISNLPSLSQLQCLSHLLLCTERTRSDDYMLSIDLGGLQSLERFTLECYNLLALPHSTTRVRTLQHLDIWCCNSLRGLPEDLGALTGLTHLTVSGTRPDHKMSGCAGSAGLYSLPESLGNLVQLQELFLQHCSFYRLPESVGSLGNLKLLFLQDCGGLHSIPSSIGSLTSLKDVSLVYCMGLQQLPDSFSQLTALTRICVDRCGILGLPDLGQLKKLECLTLNCCRQLRALPTSVGQLSSLKSLDVTACSALKDLPDGLGQLTALRLCLKDCTGLKALPASVSKLEPELAGCFGLLPGSFGEQPKFFSW